MFVRNVMIKALFQILGALTILMATFFVGRLSVTSSERSQVASQFQLAERSPEARVEAGEPSEDEGWQTETVAPQLQPLTSSELTGSLFAQAMNDPRIVNSRVGLALALQSATEADIPSMVEAYENRVPGVDVMYASDMLMTAWGQFDGPAAVAYAEKHMDRRKSRIAATTAMQAWSESNPEAAVAWLTTQETPETKAWFPGIVAGIAQGNVRLASELMQNMKGSLRRNAADKVLDAYQRLGTENMLSYVNSIEDERLLSEVQQSAARRLASIAPVQYMSWIKGIEGDGLRNSAMRVYAQEWAATDPEQAMRYFETMEDKTLQPGAMHFALSTWVQKDMEEAAAWVSGLEPGSMKDFSLGVVARRIVAKQPEVALEFALETSDEQKRYNNVKRALQDSVRLNPAGATELIGEEAVMATKAEMKEARANRSQ